jgi:hypothetical protein
MVLRKIGKDSSIESELPDAALVERVRRNFHHCFGHALADAFGKKRKQVAGFRSGVR